jgi:histone methylation protein DOT1
VRYHPQVPSLKANPELLSTLTEWWRQNVAEMGTAATARQFVTELWGFLRDSTPEQRRRRYGDVEYDWDHRVDTTSATVGWRDRLLGVFHSPYQPTEPALFHEMLAALNIAFEDFTFIDLGSGKGRTLLMASDYPFRRIVGIELLPELHRVAQENLEKYKSEAQRCFQLESLCTDARQYIFPAEPVVLYLSNPLPRAGLAQVIDNLERSLGQHPRKVRVLYHNPMHEDMLPGRRWLRRTAGTHQFSLYETH